MGIKPRLEMVLRSVPANSVVADIGTDHAFLPIALISRGIAKKVIAADISEGPLNVAYQNIKAANVGNIDVRLSDGLESIAENEVDTVVIAGMGGDVITNILSRANWLKCTKITLVLQAMSSAEVLRVWLYTNGFIIVKENGVTDSGRVYSVITAKYNGGTYNYTMAEKYTGEICRDNSDDATRYITLQYNRVSECAKNLKNVQKKEAEYKENFKASKELKKILDGR